MQFHIVTNRLKTAVYATLVLLLGAGLSLAQQVNISAGPATLTTPDGSLVPMWGYSCDAVQPTGSTVTCRALSNASGWSPILITVPSGTNLTIQLTNNLSFTPAGGATNYVPTSVVIVGQLGGGLGDVTKRTTSPSPLHDNQSTTWPIAATGPTFTPPQQGARVQSFGTEVAAVGATLAAGQCASPCSSLTWTAPPRPGTYLLESGTHPSIQGPMGLYGIVVVTTAPSGTTPGTAYGTVGSPTAVTYAAEVPLALSEVDPVQNQAVTAAVNTNGFVESATYGPNFGGAIVSLNVTNGGSGYTGTPTVTATPSGGESLTAVVDTDSTSPTYQQVIGITINNGGNFTAAPVISITGGGGSGATAVAGLQLHPSTQCSGGALACYPPAVNYTPLYYLVNGTAFNKTNSGLSLFPTSPATAVAPGSNVLVRLVNAGLRMHVPSIVGAQTGASNAPGFSLIAEDGNPLPGVPRVQSEVFMAAGKTYDVMLNAPATTVTTALPIYDRELSLSGNATARDSGMLAYISVNGETIPAAASGIVATARADSYFVVPAKTLNVLDPGKGVIANDTNVFGVHVTVAPTQAAVVLGVQQFTLNVDGTFSYTPSSSFTSDSFTYCGNGATSGAACATVTLGPAPIEAGSGIIMANDSFTSNVATTLSIKPPGVLANDRDTAGYPLTVFSPTTVTALTGPGTGTLSVDPNGGFNATVSAPGTYTFTYSAQNSQGTKSASTATVTLIFPTPTNLAVTVVDGADKTTQITDYRWIIEEDRTFYVNPACTANPVPNPPPAHCPTATGGIVPTFGTNFHTSYMPIVATGCTGQLSCESGQTLLGQPAVCDAGNGVCRTTGTELATLDPASVHLDPNKRYYISILPGDAGNPFAAGYGGSPACTSTGGISTPNPNCGHGMGGAPITFGQTKVTILTQPAPYPTAKLSVFVFEDDFPLNGEQDGGGGVDVLSPNEPGLGGFNITLFDDAGGTGDATGQMTYDMFNMPLSNSLDGTIDPATGLNACPITQQGNPAVVKQQGLTQASGITGTIVTCPKFEADGATLSPLAGQAVVANLMPGRYGVVATPAADRIGRGEEWLQTNTLDGQKAHDSFLRIGEPSFFQEFGPAGYHVSIGFANPQIINNRKQFVCDGTDPNISGTNCNNTVTGFVSTERMSRTPDERLYGSGDNSSFSFTQCFVSFGDPDGEDFAFTKCASDGSFSLSGLPDGDWRITVFDQWNDMLVDGLSTPVRLGSSTSLCPGTGSSANSCNMGEIAMNQWQANIYTTTFFDANGNGVRDSNEQGLALVATNIRFRDGSYSNFNNTDLNGFAGFNEVFPLFSWYVVETDQTRYKNTGTHVVYDAGGPADGNPNCGGNGTANCGSSTIAGNMANTYEALPVPGTLHVPGAVYCNNADCTGQSIKNGPNTTSAPNSTGRIDPPWVMFEGWQGFSGQNSFIEFGKTPFAATENGGIHGEVIYASTRPFDDPTLLIHTSWTPDVPGVTINLYQEGTAPDGTTSLTLVDTTKTSSWDDWAQGFRSDGVPNMNCPGQGSASGTNPDLFFFTLFNQPMWLDAYNNGTPTHTIPNNSQFKCYDGMHNWNQVQPAPYDGYYTFPSIIGRNPTTGAPTGNGGINGNLAPLAGTNCMTCTPNPTDGTPMLPVGKYVVEMIVPPGYELVKEEDKNILIGDNYIAPVTQEFAGLGNIFILPDQAEVASLFNANNPQNSTNTLGRTLLPTSEGDTGSVETFWPCVGATRIVPDFISLFPQSGEVSPFAGATRNLCDRKEVQLDNQMSVLAKFWVFTPAHVAAHFTGVITDDYTSEFDPFSPQFGEKFSPPNLPISVKDWSGTEISRVYADQWGTYNGLTYSTWEVNPPNPTGYAPTMMVTCMNDPGDPSNPDPLFNPQYSQFCYEIPFMPGQTQYMDTPVVPTSAFAGAGYNNPDCAYPAATPAILSVVSNRIAGPWVQAAGDTLTITALGDQQVPNNAYSGPSATTAPFNQKTVIRHYGFGTTAGTVTIGGVAATVTAWSDTQLTVTVPANVPACGIQQQAQYGGSAASCGELLITAANGQKSIDSVTITIGGKQPTLVTGTTPLLPSGIGSIQQAIDAALPGDMIIVGPGVHAEMLQMWKPVRLQGIGAASSIINANTQPAGKMTLWRERVDCMFGLSSAGTPAGWNASCGAGWGGFTPTPVNPQVDRLPLEATVGWDASLNGNLAELLQEPSLMGALEGAAITVLSKGVDFKGQDPFASSLAAGFPPGTTLLSAQTCVDGTPANANNNPFPSSFWCNPSSIDGLGITDSSQGGGGVFVHGWGHNLEIANNRIHSNAGTLSGGINVGQGEFPGAYLQGAANADPGSCQTSNVANVQLPYCFDEFVNIHNNAITDNSSTGDELFSATPAGAGGVSFCTGSDYYKFRFNWVCGNLSTGDGGGIGQLGFVYNGDIEHNTLLFNQSTNPTIPANGGAILAMGAPDVDPTCGAQTDLDCVPALGSVGPSDGIGPGLVINANLIMGNSADAGSGGGIRLQNLNGSDVLSFPNNPEQWYEVNVTNNIITNNVAGWDGAGISLVDALKVNIINNTIMSNDTTASSGVLFNTIGAPLASSSGPTCTSNCGITSQPQPAGLVSIQTSAVLNANLPAQITCPDGHFAPGTSAINGTCRSISYPKLYNDVFWQNRAFYIGVGTLGSGTLNQQNVVALFNAFTTTQAASQPTADATTPNGAGVIISGGTGACVTASYWDIGVRGDTTVNGHQSTFTLAPTYSVVTDASDYPSLNNSASNPTVVSQYCNGSRVPPEFQSMGYQVPPGISDATVPNPIFNLTPAATVDEGNNWINLSWGPLAETNAVNNTVLGNYALAAGSPAINYIPTTSSTYAAAPTTDFFGNPRPATPGTAIDVGAVEFQAAVSTTPTLSAIVPNQVRRGVSIIAVLNGTNLTGATAVTVSGTGVTAVVNSSTASSVTATFTITTGAALGARTVSVTTPAGTSNTVALTVVTNATVAPTVTSVVPNSGVRGTAVPVTITGTNFTVGSTVTPAPAGITVSGTTVVNSTQINATFTIAGTAAAGARNVRVTSSGQTSAISAGDTFTVNVPNLTGISPAFGSRGSSINVTIKGNYLTGATAVNPGANITVSNFVLVDSQTVTATLNVAPAAGPGFHNITVTTPTGATNAVQFRVLGATLSFSAPSPALTTTPANTTTKSGLVTVSNTATGANAGPFTFTADPTVVKVGTTGGTFSVVAGGSCANGVAVGPGSSCTVNVQYAPGTSTATAAAHVTVTGSGIATASQSGANFNAN